MQSNSAEPAINFQDKNRDKTRNKIIKCITVQIKMGKCAKRCMQASGSTDLNNYFSTRAQSSTRGGFQKTIFALCQKVPPRIKMFQFVKFLSEKLFENFNNRLKSFSFPERNLNVFFCMFAHNILQSLSFFLHSSFRWKLTFMHSTYLINYYKLSVVSVRSLCCQICLAKHWDLWWWAPLDFSCSFS